MKIPIYIGIMITFSFINYSCGNCNLADCREGDHVQLKYLTNGHNAIFGPEATISRDSIRLYTLYGYELDRFIYYDDSMETINLYMNYDDTYLLEFKNIRTDTISNESITTGHTECCQIMEFKNVKLNSQVICQDNCSEILEIQI